LRRFCGAGTVTLFAAQHCSSLCSQSEGVDFLASFAALVPNVFRDVSVALTLRRSTVAHFARKVRGTIFWASFAAPAPNVFRDVFVALTLRRSTVAHFARKVRGTIFWASFAAPAPNVFRDVSVALTLRRSTVAHFARKVRGTIFLASFAALVQTFFAMCPWPSLCGASTVAHFARKVRGTIFWRPSRRWSKRFSRRVRGPHFASKVSYNAAPQSCAPRNSLSRVAYIYTLCAPSLHVKKHIFFGRLAVNA
jgi:hypothetical protein